MVGLALVLDQVEDVALEVVVVVVVAVVVGDMGEAASTREIARKT